MACQTYLPKSRIPRILCDYQNWISLEKKQRLMLNDWFENCLENAGTAN